MGSPKLRIAGEPIKGQPTTEPTVRLRMEEVLPLLAHAHRNDSVWLKDMADDPIIVTMDLAQILHAFSTIEQEKRGA